MARGTRIQRKYKQPGGKSRKVLNVKIAAFFLMMLLFSIVALIIPLRPTESTVEKRELTKFPEFSFQSLADGSYFKQVDLWFSDTFPFRDAFTSANSRLKTLYGILSRHSAWRGDRRRRHTGKALKACRPRLQRFFQRGKLWGFFPGEQLLRRQQQGGKAYSNHHLERRPLAGDSAFEYYNFNLEVADQYAATVNGITQKLQGKATVYDMIVPTSIDIMLSEATRAGLNTDDQKKAIDYMYGSMLDATKKVSIYDTLMAHNDEYLYFRYRPPLDGFRRLLRL